MVWLRLTRGCFPRFGGGLFGSLIVGGAARWLMVWGGFFDASLFGGVGGDCLLTLSGFLVCWFLGVVGGLMVGYVFSCGRFLVRALFPGLLGCFLGSCCWQLRARGIVPRFRLAVADSWWCWVTGGVRAFVLRRGFLGW